MLELLLNTLERKSGLLFQDCGTRTNYSFYHLWGQRWQYETQQENPAKESRLFKLRQIYLALSVKFRMLLFLKHRLVNQVNSELKPSAGQWALEIVITTTGLHPLYDYLWEMKMSQYFWRPRNSSCSTSVVRISKYFLISKELVLKQEDLNKALESNSSFEN